MKKRGRTRKWWSSLTKEERSELIYLERGGRKSMRSAYFPDDCSECPSCGTPYSGVGLCLSCDDRRDVLIRKATRAGL